MSDEDSDVISVSFTTGDVNNAVNRY